MNTEDDTYRTLRQLPFGQMIKLWSEATIMPYTQDCADFFKNYGWDFDEYMHVYNNKAENGSPEIFG